MTSVNPITTKSLPHLNHQTLKCSSSMSEYQIALYLFAVSNIMHSRLQETTGCSFFETISVHLASTRARRRLELHLWYLSVAQQTALIVLRQFGEIYPLSGTNVVFMKPDFCDLSREQYRRDGKERQLVSDHVSIFFLVIVLVFSFPYPYMDVT